MNWFKKLFNIFNKGKYEIVYSISGTWEISYGKGYGVRNQYSNYHILYNDVTNHYKLESTGYNPTNHHLYPEIFKFMRRLNEGTAYVKGGEIFLENQIVQNTNSDAKSVDTMNETECQIYLAKALEEENYELAEQIKKRLEKL
jgi:hypothetical protein